MLVRGVLAAGALVAVAGPAMAGGYGCGGGAGCYRETTLAPVYGTVSERVLLSPPRTYDVVTPAEYGSVSETVQVSGGGRVWQVSHDAHGNRVGCWVDVPPRYETRHRTVMLRQATSEPHTVPAVYGSREQTVLVEPGRRSWVPVGGGYGSSGGSLFGAIGGVASGVGSLAGGIADVGLSTAFGGGYGSGDGGYGAASSGGYGYGRGYGGRSFIGTGGGYGRGGYGRTSFGGRGYGQGGGDSRSSGPAYGAGGQGRGRPATSGGYGRPHFRG